MTGATPFEYLKTTDFTVLTIAYNWGFGSVSYFIEKFKGHTGYTPKQFANNSKTITNPKDDNGY